MALINTDISSRNEYYAKAKMIQIQKEEINNLKSEITEIRSQMSEIKFLLLQLTERT